MTDILLRPAVPGDMQTIISMIDEAAAWLRRKGTDQWANPWPDQMARDARVLRGLERGHTWLAEDSQGPVATVTYHQHANPKLWTDLEQGDRAVYLSRLVVRRRSARQEIGAKLIDWAGYRALHEWQAQWIRIDVWTTNFALHRYYTNRGFEFCRFCDDTEYPSAALFQRPTKDIRPPAMWCNNEVRPTRRRAAELAPVPLP
jgi:GNAT superfamily N-acetyltransferase